MPPSPDSTPTTLIGNIGVRNIGARHSSWSNSIGQDTDAQAGAPLATGAMNSGNGKDSTLVAVSPSLTKEKVQCVIFGQRQCLSFGQRQDIS